MCPLGRVGFLSFLPRTTVISRTAGVTVKYTCPGPRVKARKHKMLGFIRVSTSTCCGYIFLWKTGWIRRYPWENAGFLPARAVENSRENPGGTRGRVCFPPPGSPRGNTCGKRGETAATTSAIRGFSAGDRAPGRDRGPLAGRGARGAPCNRNGRFPWLLARRGTRRLRRAPGRRGLCPSRGDCAYEGTSRSPPPPPPLPLELELEPWSTPCELPSTFE